MLFFLTNFVVIFIIYIYGSVLLRQFSDTTFLLNLAVWSATETVWYAAEYRLASPLTDVSKQKETDLSFGSFFLW